MRVGERVTMKLTLARSGESVAQRSTEQSCLWPCESLTGAGSDRKGKKYDNIKLISHTIPTPVMFSSRSVYTCT